MKPKTKANNASETKATHTAAAKNIWWRERLSQSTYSNRPLASSVKDPFEMCLPVLRSGVAVCLVLCMRFQASRIHTFTYFTEYPFGVVWRGEGYIISCVL